MTIAFSRETWGTEGQGTSGEIMNNSPTASFLEGLVYISPASSFAYGIPHWSSQSMLDAISFIVVVVVTVEIHRERERELNRETYYDGTSNF